MIVNLLNIYIYILGANALHYDICGVSVYMYMYTYMYIHMFRVNH